ncbi:MAG: protein phosphatase 2C domain-containing protein, partial [Armatimonadota bacterium]
MIQSDAAFLIGRTHKVCQDYAVADNSHTDLESVWLSDGCSSSSNTDIGARLLSHGIQQRLSEFGPVGEAAAGDLQKSLLDAVLRKTIRSAARSARQIGITRSALDATLLGLVSDRETVSAVLCGDGAVVFGMQDGTRDVYRLQYPAGYPYYPVYADDRDRLSCWKRVSGNQYTVTRTTLLSDGSVGESVTVTPET